MLVLGVVGCTPEQGPVAVGTVERDRIALSAERMEPIVAVLVREGDRVVAGTPMLRLDANRLRADLAQAEARVDQSRRRLDELLRGPRQERIDEGRARLAAAESSLRTAQHELERIERLRIGNLASEAEIEQARNVRDQEQGRVDSEQAALAALVDGTTIEELDQARAALRQVEAAASHLRLDVERLTLVAPRDAVVESLPFELGESPAPGQPLVILRAIDRPPFARVHLPAEIRARVGVGATVNVTVVGHGIFGGRIRYISSEADFTPYYALTERDAGRLSYRAEIDLADADAVPSGVPARIALLDD